MKHSTLTVAVALALISFASTQTPALAAPQSDQSKACSAAADKQGLHGKDRDKFRTQCMKGGTTAASATIGTSASSVPAAPTPPAKPTLAAAPKPAFVPAASAMSSPSSNKAKEQSRIKMCGAQWKTDKAAGKTPKGETWPQYWSQCNKDMKAKGQ